MRHSNCKISYLACLAIALGAVTFTMVGQDHVPAGDLEARVDICTVFRDLESFRNKTVAVTGTLTTGWETGGNLVDSTCKSKFVTDGFVWPVAFEIVTSSDPSVKGIVSFETDQSNLKEAYRKAKDLAGPSQRSVRMTVLGFVRLRDRYYRMRIKNGLGPKDFIDAGNGFGHMGFFPGQLIVKQVTTVELNEPDDAKVRSAR